MMWPKTDPDYWRAPVDDFPPPWASAWGDDEFGLWAELTVGSVTQRMRWIEPSGAGGFLMGSTKAERERISNKTAQDWASSYENDRSRVIVEHGFWLADTPCTQALWSAVMAGDNPSHFKEGPDAGSRPVEQVNWDVVQRFLAQLAAALHDAAEAVLPTELQWEYACRAGTDTAFCWGDEPDAAMANTSESGIGGTTLVKRYPPNAWGLYDLHGNVWEWCADAWRDRWAAADASQRGAPGARRVMRGGSWSDEAGGARSAYRSGYDPGHDWHARGFRFALRSRSPEPGGLAAR